MAKSKKSKSKRPTRHAGLVNVPASEQTKKAEFEDVGNQHGLLREDLKRYRPKVNTGEIVQVKHEREAESSLELDDAEMLDAIYAEPPAGQLDGLQMTQADEDFFIYLLRNEGS
jgi:hypothetical protein